MRIDDGKVAFGVGVGGLFAHQSIGFGQESCRLEHTFDRRLSRSASPLRSVSDATTPGQGHRQHHYNSGVVGAISRQGWLPAHP